MISYISTQQITPNKTSEPLETSVVDITPYTEEREPPTEILNDDDGEDLEPLVSAPPETVPESVKEEKRKMLKLPNVLQAKWNRRKMLEEERKRRNELRKDATLESLKSNSIWNPKPNYNFKSQATLFSSKSKDKLRSKGSIFG